MLTVFVALVGVAMVLMFPYRILVEQALSSTRGDQLTVAYLRNLLRTDPDNLPIRLALVRQQMVRGDLVAARSTLAPALQAPQQAQRTEALWLDWTLLETELRATPADAPARAALLARLHARLATVGNEAALPVANLVDLAHKALEYDDPSLAVRLYGRIAAASPGLDAQWYGEPARELLGRGRYQDASELFLLARSHAGSLADRRRYFMAAVDALRAANRPIEALALAERELKDLADDTQTLYYMVELARAANRPDLADHYARRMLRMSLAEQLRRFALAAQGLDGGIRPVGADDGPPPPRLPFDDRVYTLAYQAFLGNRNLADAYRVAASAVRQAPDNLTWRERLAQVSEWSGKPEVALTQWLYLAQHAERDDAWQAVLRLAPGLFEDRALLLALQHELARRPDDLELAGRIVAVYERLAEPDQALAFLQRLAARRPVPAVLEMLAREAERNGEPAQALAALDRLDALEGPDPGRAMRRAAILVTQGRPDQSLAALDAVRARVKPDDGAFWRFYGSLALLLQRDAEARKAFGHIVGLADADANDFSDLIELLRHSEPAQAARLAEQAWRRFGGPDRLQQTLQLYAAAGQPAAIERIFSGLTPAQQAAIETSPALLQLRSQWHMDHGRRDAARRDLERALALAPDAVDLRAALLWQLIDSGDAPALRRLLARHESRWAAEPGLRDALAAAWQTLSQPRVALQRYLLPDAKSHQGDFLWLMNLADVLEQYGDTDRAWTLREHLLAGRHEAGADDAALERARRIARIRLLRVQRPGDRSLAVLRELLREDRGAGGRLSPAARDLALSALLEDNDYAAARGFLWQQYGRDLARPAWAEMAVALGQGDMARVGELLDRHGEALSRYDRVNAAQALDDPALAASAAFHSMDQGQRQDDALHLQLSEILLAQADRTQIDAAARDLESVREQEAAVALDIGLTPHLRLSMKLGTVHRQVIDGAVFGGIPGREEFAAAGLAWHYNQSDTVLGVARRNAWRGYTPWSLDYRRHLGGGLDASAFAGFDLPATETTALRIAGLKDRFGVGLRYQLAPSRGIGVNLDHLAYRAQNGLAIGSANRWQLSFTQLLRSGSPGLELDAYASGLRFSSAGGGDPQRVAELAPLFPAGSPPDVSLFEPDSQVVWGANLSTDSLFLEDYTRALRPFATLGVNHGSVSGDGYVALFGAAGPLLGNDHLGVGLRQEKGGTGPANRTREAFFNYRLYF